MFSMHLLLLISVAVVAPSWAILFPVEEDGAQGKCGVDLRVKRKRPSLAPLNTEHTAYSARGGTTKNRHYSRFGTISDIFVN